MADPNSIPKAAEYQGQDAIEQSLGKTTVALAFETKEWPDPVNRLLNLNADPELRAQMTDEEIAQVHADYDEFRRQAA